MWSIQDVQTGQTNKAIVPIDGIISVSKPDSVQVSAFVNDVVSAVHHVHVKSGDTVYFKLKSTADTPTSVTFDYAGTTSKMLVPAISEIKQAAQVYSATILEEEEEEMTPETLNLFANPQGGMGGALGGGLGAGLVGGLLGTMLFRNGAIGGITDGANVPATLSGVESVVNNATINTALGDIKAAIPYNEAQMQLALAGAQADINSNITSSNASILNTINTQSVTNANYIAGVNANVSNSAAMNLAATKDSSAANLAATNAAATLAERNAWAITQAITNDGDRTRSLIQSIDKSNDSRTITNLANEVTELRHDRRLQEATGNITISNNNTASANAQQQQGQQQLQAQYQILAQLAALNADLQSVKQSSVVFNSGTQTNSGNQAAANTRVA